MSLIHQVLNSFLIEAGPTNRKLKEYLKYRQTQDNKL